MGLMSFYKNILEDVEIKVDNENYLKLQINGTEVPLTQKKGKFVLLPTMDVLNNFYVEIEGSLEPKGLIFNPIKELVTNDNVGLDIYREAMASKLTTMIETFGNNFILVLSNTESQDSLGIELNKSISSLRKNVPGMKNGAKIGDETMINTWRKIIDKIIQSDDPLVRILTSNDKTKQYAKIGKISIDFYNLLDKGADEEKFKIYDISIRPKDRLVFMEIFNLLFPNIDKNGIVREETSVKISPTFITLLNLFYNTANRYKKMMKNLEFIDTEAARSCIITHTFKKEYIDTINETFALEKNSIPAENELNTTKKVLKSVTNDKGATSISIINVKEAIEPDLSEYEKTENKGGYLDNFFNQKQGITTGMFNNSNPINYQSVANAISTPTSMVAPVPQMQPIENKVSSPGKMVSVLTPQNNSQEAHNELMRRVNSGVGMNNMGQVMPNTMQPVMQPMQQQFVQPVQYFNTVQPQPYIMNNNTFIPQQPNFNQPFNYNPNFNYQQQFFNGINGSNGFRNF